MSSFYVGFMLTSPENW